MADVGGKRVWNPHRGRFVSKAAYDKERAEWAEAERLRRGEVEKREYENDPIRLWEEALRRGVLLSGNARFEGDIAIDVVKALQELGYINKVYLDRDFAAHVRGDWTGVDISDEFRNYSEFVNESIYWYLRHLGILKT